LLGAVSAASRRLGMNCGAMPAARIPPRKWRRLVDGMVFIMI
jgi:hypothetical protein